MQNIAKSKKINFQKCENPNQAIVTIEPCYPGYGTTLGNSLRRVLLSSLSGAAAVGVKIKGATHEFTTLPNIKEDVLEIILNLKQLKLKQFSDEEIKLELKAHGKKTVKASDISKNSSVKIVNPDLILAHITDITGSLDMEIYVDQGIGYRPTESIENKKKKVGYIEMDSIFSPVLSVEIHVENVRIGKMTNWDKLILNITTDGSISPEEAYNTSVEILIDQLKSLIKKEEDTNKLKDKKKKEKIEKTKKL